MSICVYSTPQCCRPLPSCCGCCKGDHSCSPTCPSCCTNCGSITSCFPSCSCTGCCSSDTCVCLCLEIKLHKGSKSGGEQYRDSNQGQDGDAKKEKGETTEQGGGDGRLFNTHLPPGFSPSKQQYNERGGTVITDVLPAGMANGINHHRQLPSAPGKGRERDDELNSQGIVPSLKNRNRSLPLSPDRNMGTSGRIQVSFKSTHGRGHRHQRKLPLPPKDNQISSKVGSASDKNLNHSITDEMRRSSSRTRRSIQAGQRSQRYPNKFLVDADSLTSSTELSVHPHKASTPGQTDPTDTQGTDTLSSTCNGLQTTTLISSGANSTQSTHLTSSGSSRRLLSSEGSTERSRNSQGRNLPKPKMPTQSPLASASSSLPAPARETINLIRDSR
ncbi:hypothetical protein PoB_001926000 [Plakobranchus ocellatus]|uniref:Uncharacterized protein n=1 Tax=Plakobranchus ocellatus TaxID=259542 RepID=A0AAV3ZDW4_9GAST|nr:hypothetical protein PoB_001926000 [Plakobranchus ocellatus]